MNDSEAFRRASDGFMQRARQIRAEQWAASTPCSEWNVRALVNHVGGEFMWVTELMGGRSIAEVGSQFDGDVLGDEPVARLAAAQGAAAASFDEPDAATRTVQLSFGATPAMDYARQMACDSVIHSWDLARAIGADETLDADLVDYAYAEMLRSAEDWRAGGVFGPVRTPADNSTQAKLLALTGR